MEDRSKRLDDVFKSDIIQLPLIKITSNHYHNEQDKMLYENLDTSPFRRQDQVVITFLISGYIESSYKGIQQNFLNSDRSATFIYGPLDNYHFLPQNQYINSLSMGIEKDFFYPLINNEDPWIEELLNKIEKNIPFSLTSATYKLSPHVCHLLEQIRNPKHEGSLKTLFQQAKVYELLMLQIEEIKRLANYSPQQPISLKDREGLYALKTHLEENYLTNYTLDELARLYSLNTFKIKKGFKILFGKSVFEYIRELRMQFAFRLLQDTDKTVGQVAERLGYEHIQHFSSAFKKHYNHSPSKLKR
jgi:AraC-like DNA-binding protein